MLRLCWTIGGLTLLAVAAVAVAGIFGAGHVSRGTEAARSGVSAAKAGDQDRSAASFTTASEEFGAADDLFNAWFIRPSRLIPLVSDQTDALGRMASIGRDLADAASTVTSEADYRRITASDGRIDVDQIRSWSAPLDDIDHALRSADEVSDSIDVEWLLPQIRGRYADLDAEVTGAIEEISTAKALVAVAPDLLGGSGTRRYFIAFTTPAESRGLGGFMGNWAILEATDGRLELMRSGRSDELRPSPGDPARVLDAPADYLARYGPLLPEQEVRDITFSPDFPSVGQALASVYPQTLDGAPIDGALALDPYAVAAMLEITGPIRVEGLAEPLTSENAADYLLREQYLTFDPADVDGERIDILEEASRTTFEEFVSAGSFRPSQLASVLGPMVAERRLVAYSSTPAEQDAIRAVGLDGAFPSAGTDDFMALVTQNAGNNKIDIFLHRTIDYAATIDPGTGKLRATATITLRNEAPDHGLPRYVIGNRPSSGQPDGANWLWFNFYTPHRFESATLDGQPLAISASNEFGLNVINTFLAVPPGGTAVVEISLRGEVGPGDQYRLRWFQQPTVNTDKVTVWAQGVEARGDGPATRPDRDGVTTEERTDQQIDIDLGP